AASVLGYSVVSSIAGRGSCGHVGRPGRNGSHEAASQEQHREEVATSAGLTSGVMAFVGSLASAALRQYALQKLRSFEK
ncbi:MAG: hypothetical protein KDA45_15215, partial [Planctomycetales bacterium]|nr:hypothetical protein [Planctomycetales bacterium]